MDHPLPCTKQMLAKRQHTTPSQLEGEGENYGEEGAGERDSFNVCIPNHTPQKLSKKPTRMKTTNALRTEQQCGISPIFQIGLGVAYKQGKPEYP